MHYVSIVGPPATGKSSLASELARSFQCDLFRLRQWVHASALIDPRTGDRKAWLDADIVEQALCQFLGSLDAGWHTTREAPVFVTDNFPGTGEQVCQLQQLVSARLGTSGAVYLALKANGQLLARRADERRVCQVCRPSRTVGDPTDVHAAMAT
jgi:adenylate kinase family enzyme